MKGSKQFKFDHRSLAHNIRKFENRNTKHENANKSGIMRERGNFVEHKVTTLTHNATFIRVFVFSFLDFRHLPVDPARGQQLFDMTLQFESIMKRSKL